MSLYLGNTPICGGIEGNQLNNPFSLLDYKYSEYALDNASWLLSNGQWNNGAVYTAVYNLLLQIYNGTTTKAGVSVKLSTETYADTDFVLNTGDTTFRLPTKVLMAGSKRVVGNGITLGLTNGTNNYGACSGSYPDRLGAVTGNYNKTVGQANSGSALTGALSVGITTDETKSGIETSANGLYLYFYVGDTVQDASVIAAAGVLTDVADLKNASNFSSVGKEAIVGWGEPDYSRAVTLAINTESSFDAWWWGDTNHYQNWAITLPDGTTTKLTGVSAGGLNSTCFQFFPKGTKYTSAYNNYVPKLLPLKGQ